MSEGPSIQQTSNFCHKTILKSNRLYTFCPLSILKSEYSDFAREINCVKILYLINKLSIITRQRNLLKINRIIRKSVRFRHSNNIVYVYIIFVLSIILLSEYLLFYLCLILNTGYLAVLYKYYPEI